jgi:carbon-monoxide dehydrogenase medium subunit
VKPPPFEYLAPTTLEEALHQLEEGGFDARALAGGQSLIPMLNFRLARPSLLVDLNRVDELSFFRAAEDGSLNIGAMSRQRDVERSPDVRRVAPLLAEALQHVAHPQIRNRGTLGGSLAHADPAAELPAVMLALEARFRVGGVGGDRWIPAAEFFFGPFMAALEPGELLLEVELPARHARDGSAFEEVARRRGDYALLGVAAHVRLDPEGVCERAALGYVNGSHTPNLAAGASGVLVGSEPTPDRIAEASRVAAADDCAPPSDIHASEAYRRRLVEVLTRRALERAFARATEPDEP